MKYIYFGSSLFSCIILEKLYAEGALPSLVISRPDKPKGRGLKVEPVEVSVFASNKNIPLLKPASLKEKDFITRVKNESSDFLVVADYGKILPQEVLSAAKVLPLAVHPSLLPKYRGAAPINWALINGETATGITIFKMNEKLDSGEIILEEMFPIADQDDALTLHHKLAQKGAQMLLRVFAMIAQGDYALVSQDEKAASFAPKLTKADGKINWGLTALQIKNLIRATIPWPKAYTFYAGKLLQVLAAEVILGEARICGGQIVSIEKRGISVATAENLLCIRRVKPQGKKEMDAYAFSLGHGVKVGDRFGE
jgi:methionyl-tRNA formyltransferase